MSIIDEITGEFTDKKMPPFKAGDTVRVYLKIREGEKERVQYFEGYVLGIHRNGISSTFKVRKESYGIGVERTFPLFSPLIQKIEVKRKGDVRRGKLYYLRERFGKKARVKEKKDWMIKKKTPGIEEASSSTVEAVSQGSIEEPGQIIEEETPVLEAKEEGSVEENTPVAGEEAGEPEKDS